MCKNLDKQKIFTNISHLISMSDSKIKIELNLERLTIRELRTVAKKYNIRLRGVTKKVAIVALMDKYFYSISNKMLPVVAEKFNVLVDTKGRIEIST